MTIKNEHSNERLPEPCCADGTFEETDDWIPLVSTTSRNNTSTSNKTSNTSTSTEDPIISHHQNHKTVPPTETYTSYTTSPTAATTAAATTTSTTSSTTFKQRHQHETRHKVKLNLIDRPLSKFWRLVIRYIFQEIWACHVLIRLGTCLILNY